MSKNLVVFKRANYSKMNAEINKVVRNYNAKVVRVSKYADSFNYSIPEKVSVKELKRNTYTINEMRRKIRNLEKYTQRGMEKTLYTKDGYNVSKYDLEILKRESRRVKNIMTREIKRLEETAPTSFGKLQARTFAQMGDSKYLNLKATREKLNVSIEKLNAEELASYKTLVNKRGRSYEYSNSLFRENYVKMLTDAGYFVGYDKKMMTLNDKQVEELMRKHNKDDLFKFLKLKEKNKDGAKVYEVNKMKYLEYSLSKIKSNKKFYKFYENEKAIKSIVDYYVLSTGKVKGFNPENVSGDLTSLYDDLIDNLDEYMQPYL